VRISIAALRVEIIGEVKAVKDTIPIHVSTIIELFKRTCT